MTKIVDKVNVSAQPFALEISEQIHALRHLFKARRFTALRSGPAALGPMEARVILFLGGHPGARQAEVVARLARDKGQVARLVASLREADIVRTRPDETDRRQQRLELTSRGREVLALVKAEQTRVADRAVAGLSTAEREALIATLQRMRTNLEE